MSLEITRHHVFLSTAPQASPEDMVLVAKQGFASVMNNRPDFEHDANQPTAQSVADAAHVAGMDFYNLPFSASRVTPELLVQFAQVVGQAKKPILLYCRSGARSTAIYRMAVEAGYLNAEDLSLVSD
ncbi:MAG: TIGR01244 family phosphatase [Burkholderiales bacterium]|nr:TIGR01244 family phosphatase [Burkholderiales bacterium]